MMDGGNRAVVLIILGREDVDSGDGACKVLGVVLASLWILEQILTFVAKVATSVLGVTCRGGMLDVLLLKVLPVKVVKYFHHHSASRTVRHSYSEQTRIKVFFWVGPWKLPFRPSPRSCGDDGEGGETRAESGYCKRLREIRYGSRTEDDERYDI